MQELTTDELKKILKAPAIKGTPQQVRLLAVRVTELCQLNGRDWVAANASRLLNQWETVLSRMTAEKPR